MEKSRQINLGEWKNPAQSKTPREFSYVGKKLFEAKKSVFHEGMDNYVLKNPSFEWE